MKPAFTLCLAAMLSAVPALAADLEITDPDQTTLVLAVNDAVDAATESIGTCREAGGELNDCLCANETDLDLIRSALDEATAAHPEWAGKALFVSDMGDGQSLTIFLDTVARMVEPPDCN